MHSYCGISPAGRVAAKATAPDGSDAGSFSPGEGLRAEIKGTHPGAGGSNSDGHWGQGEGASVGAEPSTMVKQAVHEVPRANTFRPRVGDVSGRQENKSFAGTRGIRTRRDPERPGADGRCIRRIPESAVFPLKVFMRG